MNARRAEHDYLRETMVRFADLMRATGKIDHAALTRERMLFSQAFTAHLAYEQAEVAQLAAVSLTLRDKASARGAMIAQLRGDYSTHVRHWTPQRIKDEFSEYRKAVLTLQTRLRKFMLWEEQNLPIYA